MSFICRIPRTSSNGQLNMAPIFNVERHHPRPSVWRRWSGLARQYFRIHPIFEAMIESWCIHALANFVPRACIALHMACVERSGCRLLQHSWSSQQLVFAKGATPPSSPPLKGCSEAGLAASTQVRGRLRGSNSRLVCPPACLPSDWMASLRAHRCHYTRRERGQRAAWTAGGWEACVERVGARRVHAQCAPGRLARRRRIAPGRECTFIIVNIVRVNARLSA